MYNGKVIKDLIRQSGLQQNEVLKKLNWGPSKLKSVVNGNPTVNSLEQIANFLNVSMDVFFIRDILTSGNNVVGNSNTVGNLIVGDIQIKERLIACEALIAEKDKRIELLESIRKSFEKK